MDPMEFAIFDEDKYDPDEREQKAFWDEFHAITGLLESDLYRIKDILDKDDSQIWRRVYYRTFFAYLEGHVYSLRRMFLVFDWFIVDEKTELKIRNKKIINKTNGTKLVKNWYLPLQENIRIAYKALSKAANTDPVISDDDSFWTDLSIAIEVRNRVVHPKQSADLEISKKEIDLINNIGFSYLNHTGELLKRRAGDYLLTMNAMLKAAEETFGANQDSKNMRDEITSILKDLDDES